ncbi:FAD-dependent thymidylate synthase [compost metagenome]
MTITARIIADSINDGGVRLTTMELRYPRFVHAEFMTHRVFSRNASSSRAIPIEKMIQAVLDDPAMPVHWGKNQKGMQAEQELNQEEQAAAVRAWLDARDTAVNQALALNKLGIHKQLVNRVIEPFGHITVVVTATEWNNFLHLRDHKDAQPEIAELARKVKHELDTHIPVLLQYGQWHLPYVDVDVEYAVVERLLQVGRITRDMPKPTEVYAVLLKLSTARCARTSYLTHDKLTPVHDDDVALFTRLVGSSPLHASPTEHQATPDQKVWNSTQNKELYCYPELHGNFTGWKQHRKFLTDENVTTRG